MRGFHRGPRRSRHLDRRRPAATPTPPVTPPVWLHRTDFIIDNRTRADVDNATSLIVNNTRLVDADNRRTYVYQA